MRWSGCAVLPLLLTGPMSLCAQTGTTLPADPGLARQDESGSELSGQSGGELSGQTSGQISGQISGTVIDGQGYALRDVRVTLQQEEGAQSVPPGPAQIRDGPTVTTDADGRFLFPRVPAGSFRITARAPHWSEASVERTMIAGERVALPPLMLNVAVTSSVQVVATQQELAEAEVKAEEHQRLGGVMPNFFVTYDWKAPPLTSRQKFELAWKNSIDPGNLFVNGVIAGIQQATDGISGYHQGLAGYGKRLGADEADLWTGTFIGGAILPSLFHQDPRYFYKGTGTIRSRVLYALSTAVICRGDNGKRQPAYASMLGDLAAGALANTYYPASDRTGLGLTFENGLINVGYDALGNVVQEFLLKHLTPHPPVYGTMGKN